MPKFNYTIDNVAPLIQYTPRGNWMEGNASQDARLHEYHGQTYTTTTIANSSATLSFNGTGVWIYGAKKPNHGNYSVTLDGNHVGVFAGAGDYNIRSVLYSAMSLHNGPHTVVLSYTPIQDGHSLGIDFITYEVDIGKPDEPLDSVIVQDINPDFRYNPIDAWTSVLSDSSDKFKGFNGTAHFTSQDKANVSFGFFGDAVSIWGSVGPHNGPYSVSIDGGPPIKFNATNVNYSSQIMLFEANHLGHCNHSLVLTNEPDSFGQYMTIDYAIVTNTPSMENLGHICHHCTKRLSGSVAAGIAVGGVAVILMIFLSMWIVVWRRRRARQTVFTQVHRRFGESTDTMVPPSAASTLVAATQKHPITYNWRSPTSSIEIAKPHRPTAQ